MFQLECWGGGGVNPYHSDDSETMFLILAEEEDVLDGAAGDGGLQGRHVVPDGQGLDRLVVVVGFRRHRLHDLLRCRKRRGKSLFEKNCSSRSLWAKIQAVDVILGI